MEILALLWSHFDSSATHWLDRVKYNSRLNFFYLYELLNTQRKKIFYVVGSAKLALFVGNMSPCFSAFEGKCVLHKILYFPFWICVVTYILSCGSYVNWEDSESSVMCMYDVWKLSFFVVYKLDQWRRENGVIHPHGPSVLWLYWVIYRILMNVEL